THNFVQILTSPVHTHINGVLITPPNDVKKPLKYLVRGFGQRRNIEANTGKGVGDNDGGPPGHGDEAKTLASAGFEPLQRLDSIDHFLQTVNPDGPGLPKQGLPDFARLGQRSSMRGCSSTPSNRLATPPDQKGIARRDTLDHLKQTPAI